MTKPEFSASGYRRILETAQNNNYSLLPMSEADKSNHERIFLLRHDIDYSLDFALNMAQFESEIGVKSTYFVLPFNDFYNPFSPKGRVLVRNISDFGHEIGLHWDSSLYLENEDGIKKYFKRDLLLLGDIIGKKIVST